MTAAEAHPAVPARLAGRPLQGGLVVPWIQVALADGSYDFASRHWSRVIACFTGRRCQVDGEPLGRPLVLLGGPQSLEPGHYFGEPPVHPECARYTAAACPMVAGRRPFFRSAPTAAEGKRGKRCPDPGCECGGWVTHDPIPAEPRPAHPWLAVWVEDYAIAVTPAGKLLGAVVDRPPLKVQTVSTPAVPAQPP